MLRKCLKPSIFQAARTVFGNGRAYSSKPTGEVVIGIDLGTTNSCVAIIEDGSPKVIENSEGGRTTPSIVAFDSKGQRLVGQPARRQAVTNAKNTFFSTKRLIGRRFEDKITQLHKQSVPYNVVPGPNGDAWVEAQGKKYSPSQVGAFVLTKMKETVEAYLGRTVSHAVVTVPAYFDDSQRQATKDAGTIAGLVVHRIINEPTAASLAYGLDKKEGQTIAVFDLGGGTFDISILEISGGVFEVKATNGDTFLGGEDFDHQIANHIIEEFKRTDGVDLSTDRMAVSRIKEAAEKAKKELDHVPSVEVNLPFISQSPAAGVKHLVTNLTKQDFEKMTDELIKRTMGPCQTCLRDAKITASQIDQVILVGGMTRTPKVIDSVKKFFNKEPFKGVNPDEVVAVGAAIQGAVLAGSLSGIILVDVTPLSLGIDTKGDVYSRIIPKNTPIPVRKTKTYVTADDFQTTMHFTLFQGERERASANKLLGNMSLSGIPPAPKGVAHVDVTFDIDANGLVHATAMDKATGVTANVTVRTSGGLSEKEIERMLKEAETSADSDKQFMEKAQAKNDADECIYTSEKFIRAPETSDKIPAEDKMELHKFIRELNDIRSNDSAKTEELKAATDKIRQKVMKLGEAIYRAGSTSNNNSNSSSSSSSSSDSNSNSNDTSAKK